MEMIYKDMEFHIAELLGWFGIVDTPNGYIGYPEGTNPAKLFRSNIPQYIRNKEINEAIAMTYDVEVNEHSYYYSGETYVAHFKDHVSKEMAKQYLIVIEAIETLEEDLMPTMTPVNPLNTMSIVEFKKDPYLVMDNYPYEVDY